MNRKMKVNTSALLKIKPNEETERAGAGSLAGEGSPEVDRW